MNKYGVGMLLAMSVIQCSWADNPCSPIAVACEKAGYYKGGQNVNKGLVVDCIMPIVTHTKTLPDVTFSENVLSECKVLLIEKMQERIGDKK